MNKSKLNWNSLNEYRCPKCSDKLSVGADMTTCNCGFNIKNSSYFGRISGKVSEAYIKKAKYYANLSKRRDEQRTSLRQAKQTQESERLSNLSKLLSKGEISQQEYNLKILRPKAKRIRRSIVEVKEIMI